MEFYNVGRIVNTQGLRGEVRVIVETDFPDERFKKGSELTIFDRDNKPVTEVVVSSSRPHKNFLLVSFEGHPSINDVEKYKGTRLMVAESDLGELEEDEGFYYHQILGLTVIDTSDKEIGRIKEILSLPANDVWVVQRFKKKDLLIPYIDDVVMNIDFEKGQVVIDPIEGLIDDED